MKARWMVGWACVLLAIGAAAQNAEFTFDTATSTDALLPMPAGVTATWDNGAVKVEYGGTEAVSAPLVRVELSGVHIPYVFQARMKSLDLSAPAYLEMWSEFASGSYFSRALDQTFTGTQDWRVCATPFFLKPSDPEPVAATLGVRLDGPGTVWVDDIILKPIEDAPPSVMGVVSGDRWTPFWAIAGSLLGILGGSWGAAVGFLAPKGKGRGPLLAAAYVFIALGVVSLSYGLWAIFASQFTEAYPAILLGLIDTVLFSALIPMVRRRYEEAELRRMQALDVT